jgi:hypothetical protein
MVGSPKVRDVRLLKAVVLRLGAGAGFTGLVLDSHAPSPAILALQNSGSAYFPEAGLVRNEGMVMDGSASRNLLNVSDEPDEDRWALLGPKAPSSIDLELLSAC